MTQQHPSPIESHCARCLRPNPDDIGDLPTDWEAVTTPGGTLAVICEDCITPEEQQALDEDDMDLGDELEE